jgi:hypothetical protein
VTGTAPQGAGWTTTGATRITLGPGETIYNLSKRYGVPASEIIKANNIADASRVSAGRQLLIPVYVYSRQAPVSAPDNNPKTRAANSGAGSRGEARHDRIPIPAPAPGVMWQCCRARRRFAARKIQELNCNQAAPVHACRCQLPLGAQPVSIRSRVATL